MALINKISKLTKIPQLLRRKERLEEDLKRKRRNKKDDTEDKPDFLFQDETTLNNHENHVEIVEIKALLPAPKDTRKELGQHIDIRV